MWLYATSNSPWAPIMKLTSVDWSTPGWPDPYLDVLIETNTGDCNDFNAIWLGTDILSAGA